MLRKYTEKNFAETYFKFQISLPRLARGLIHWNLLRNNHRQHGLDLVHFPLVPMLLLTEWMNGKNTQTN